MLKNLSLLLILSVLLAGCASEKREDLSWKQRLKGVSISQVMDMLIAEDPDSVRQALVLLSYGEFKDNDQARRVKNDIMHIYATYLGGITISEAGKPAPPPPTDKGPTLIVNPHVMAKTTGDTIRMEADPLMRATAARCIGKRGDFLTDEALQALLSALENDTDPMVRADCAHALGVLLRKDTSAPLVRSLHVDASAQVRMASARALAGFTKKAAAEADHNLAVEGLIARLDDKEPGVRHASCDSLHELTGKEFGVSCDDWLQWAAENGIKPQ